MYKSPKRSGRCDIEFVQLFDSENTRIPQSNENLLLEVRLKIYGRAKHYRDLFSADTTWRDRVRWVHFDLRIPRGNDNLTAPGRSGGYSHELQS